MRKKNSDSEEAKQYKIDFYNFNYNIMDIEKQILIEVENEEFSVDSKI